MSKGKRYSERIKFEVGQLLLERGRRIDQKQLAKDLEVSERTLKNWKKYAKEGAFPKVGRPNREVSECLRAVKLVQKEWRKQGFPGIRPVAAKLKGQVPRRLVNKYVPKLARLREQKARKFFEQKRITTKVKATGVIWSQDGTHLGRLNGKKVEAQVIKDSASMELIELKAAKKNTSSEVIAYLEKVKKKKGLPLVWRTDNGPNYVSEEVQEFLKKEKVIHLKSRPRTPEDNGGIERHMQEIKKVSQLGKGRKLEGLHEVDLKLSTTKLSLNCYRLYPSKGMITALDLAEKLPMGYNIVDREIFYNKCMQNIESECESVQDKRCRRQKEREAIFKTLEHFGLIERRRNGRLLHEEKRETFL